MTFKAGGPSASNSTADLSLALERPSDPIEAATEIRYRMSLSHAFHHLSGEPPREIFLNALTYISF
jgi:hypothetical protein